MVKYCGALRPTWSSEVGGGLSFGFIHVYNQKSLWPPFDSANDSAEVRGRVQMGAFECGRVRATV